MEGGDQAVSKTVDERVVKMQFDNQQFEQGVKTTMSSLDKFKQALKLDGATKGLENVDAATKKVNMSGLSDSIEAVRLKFSALEVMGVTALSNITNEALNAGKKVVKAFTIDPVKSGFQEYETQINAVQTILANTSSKGTTLDQVNNALDELNHYADLTIYNFTEMTRNIGTFTAAGVDLDTSVQAIKGIANLAAVSGSNAQQASTAMYQLSQALAAGTVKLQDWNSVVNAGMGGQVFQDALKETARVHGIAIDEMIEKEGSFRETLSKGWLSSEVLTETLSKFTGDLSEAELKNIGYTDEQIKAIMKMGQTANDAATKVKTFTQLKDTLMEAAQSGWTESWEIIVGDFGEAKETLTDMSNTLGNIIQKFADDRNNLLLGGMASGWKQLLKQGISDEAGYIESIENVARANGNAFDKIVKKSENFSEALKKGLNTGVISSDTLTKAIYELQQKMSSMNEEELKSSGYTDKMVTQMEELADGLHNGSISMDEFVTKILKPSGRENIIESLWNSLNTLLSILKPIRESFYEIFPPTTSKQLYETTENIKEFTAHLRLSSQNLENLKKTFRGLFAIVDIGKQLFSAMIKALGTFVDETGILSNNVLKNTANFGDWLVKIDESIKKSDIFNKGFQRLTKSLISGLNVISSFFEKVYVGISGVGSGLNKTKKVIQTTIGSIETTLEKSKILQIISTIYGGIEKIGSTLFTFLGKMLENIGNSVKSMDSSGIFEILSGISFAGIAVGIIKFINAITAAFKGITTFKDQVKGVLDSVRECFEAYQTRLKAGILTKIATAIGVLTAAIVVLTFIDQSDIKSSLAALAGLFAELLVAVTIFSKISDDFSNVKKSATIMLGLSTSVLILASALKRISHLSWEGIAKGLTGITVISAALTVVSRIIAKDTKVIIKGAFNLISFAAAIKILASACSDLSQFSWTELVKGLMGIGVLMGEIALFLNFAKFSGKVVSTATGILILSAAIKVLSVGVREFGSIQWETLKIGLMGIGVILAEIAAFTNLTGEAKHVISTGVALIAISGAVIIMASAIHKLGSMNLDEIGKGLTALAGALFEITLAANFMPKNMISVGVGLIAIAESFVILSNGLNAINNSTWEDIIKGLFSMGVVLIELTTALHFIKGMLGASITLLIISASLLTLAQSIKSFENVDLKHLITFGGVMAMIVGIMKLVSGTSFTGAAGIAIMAVGMLALATALKVISAIPIKNIITSFAALGLVIGGLATASLIIKPLAGGVAVLIAALLTLSVTMIAFGAGALLFANSLQVSANALPGLTDGLVYLVTSLAGCKDSIKDFAVAMSMFGSTTIKVLSEIGVGLVVFAVGLSVAAVAVLALGVGLAGLGLGLGVVAIAIGIASLGAIGFAEAFKMGCEAVGILGNGLTTLGTGFQNFITACISCKESMGDFKSVMLEVGSSIYEMLKEVAGGTTLLAGGLTLGGIALIIFSAGLTVFAGVAAISIGTLELFSATLTTLNVALNGSATAIKNLAVAFADAMLIIAAVFTGNIEALKSAGSNVAKGFAEGMDSGSKDVEQSSAGLAAKVVSVICSVLGIHSPSIVAKALGAFTGEGFALGLDDSQGKVGESASNLGNISIESLTNSGAFKQLGLDSGTDFAAGLTGSGSKVSDATGNLQNISLDSLGDSSAFKGLGLDSGTSFASGLSEGAGNNKSLNNAMDAMLDKSANSKESFKKSGNDLMTSFTSGVSNKKTDAVHSITTILTAMRNAARAEYNSFRSAGVYLVEGFAKGIKESNYKAAAKAKEMAKSASDAAKKQLDEHSPSKVFYKIGDFAGQGFVNGLDEYAKVSHNAGARMGVEAQKGLGSSISKIVDTMNDMDFDPTIRPVMDLSRIHAGISEMSRIMPNGETFQVGANVEAISSNMQNRQNGVNNADVIRAIDRLGQKLDGRSGDSYTIDGVTYDDGSNIAKAVNTLTREIKVRRRM